MSDRVSVVLVNMPFGHLFSPSIGLSLLKAELAMKGIRSRVRYFSIRFAEMVGQGFYHGLCAEGRPSIEDLAGEWIFSAALFGPGPRDEQYVEQILRKRTTWTTNAEGPASPALVERILGARTRVDGYLEWCLAEVVRESPRVLGFTSVFQQHAASLALARMVKQAIPETFIVFGGSNCEDVMGAETVRQFPFVDAAVSGEGDIVFPDLVQRVLEGRSVSGLPGVRTRDGVDADFARGTFSTAPMVRQLDELPYPDYADYFEQFAGSRFGREWQPSVFFETSRGCWWGEKMHCTFCGLNPATMAFRSKSATRALEELAYLTERHPECSVEVTDNILDMRYFKDFVPGLAARGSDTVLFYEVKANLKKEQLRQLRDAGVSSIQPGIESFSDVVLRLMRKGVAGLHNIQLLKWCKQLGIEPFWNLLWGFPGEPPEEYGRMARMVPLLTHLPPPVSYGVIRLDRFSPNFVQAERFGFVDVRPLPPYRYVYQLPDEAVANLAFFFTFGYREPRDVGGYVAPLERELKAWRRRWQRHDLFSVEMGDRLCVWDLRPGSREPLVLLRGVDKLIYQACDSACDVRGLADALEDGVAPRLSAAAIEQRIAPMLERGLLIGDGSRYLALAIPLGDYSPPAAAVARLYDVAKDVGTRVPGGWVVPAADVERSADVEAGPPVRPFRRGVRSRRSATVLTRSHFSAASRTEVFVRADI